MSSAPAFHGTSTMTDDDLTGRLQCTLAALADVELEYEIERERLEQWDGPEAERKRRIEELEVRRQEQRQPLTQILADLHQKVTLRSIRSRLR